MSKNGIKNHGKNGQLHTYLQLGNTMFTPINLLLMNLVLLEHTIL